MRRFSRATPFATILLAFALIVGTLLAVLAPLNGTASRSAIAAPNVMVLTQHNDNGRTGQNLNETTLTTSNVNSAMFGKLFSRAVDGQLYAQPLYVPNLTIPGQGTHNVVFVATTHNTVYAFDADDPALSTPLWSVNLGSSIPVPDACFGYRYGALHDIKIEVGIISTPVIDINSGTMYVVAATKDGVSVSPNCVPTVYHHRMHALDITTGAEKFGGPKQIDATVPGTGPDAAGGTISLNNMQQLQRPALTLANGKVYIAFGSYADTDNYHGWVLAYDAATLTQTAAWTNEPDVFTDTTNQPQPYEGGIWQAGQGLTVDNSGNLYMNIGNGDFNADTGGNDLGDSIVKLSPALGLLDWFTPYNVGNLNRYDTDLGSSGTLLLPGTNYLVAGGKQGVLYLLNTGNMGHFNSVADTQIPQSFQATVGHIHGTPIYWNGPTGPRVYVWSELDYMKMFTFGGTSFNTTPTTSPAKVPNGMPGGFLSLSANGSTAGSGIVWASHPLNADANPNTVAGILEAYDATDITKRLWTSEQNSARDTVGNFAKFAPPTVANGRVYLGTFSNQLLVYGLLSSLPTSTPTATLPAGVPSSTSTSTSTATATPAPVPSPWTDADVGTVGVAGSATYTGGTFTITGSGDDIWNAADAFNYVYRPWTGDGTIVARVTTQTNSDPWAKAGVMFRETLGSNSTFADMVVTPGNGAAFQYRPTTGGQAVHVAGPTVTAPYWVKLTRQGTTLTGFVSSDNITWTQVGSISITMATTILVGLPVTAHNNTTTSTVAIENVLVTAPAVPTSTATALATSTATASATTTATATATSTASNTATSTATATKTNTPVTPSATSTASPSSTATATATNTPVTPSATATNTPAGPTATATNTPTSTSTSTPAPPTATKTNTPVPPSATSTNTVTATATVTNTPVPATATQTNTPVPPSPTATITPVPTATSTPGSTLANGLVGYWTMNEGSGTSIADSSGNANTGAFHGGLTWATGKFGGGVQFNGSNGYISAGVTAMPAANAAQSASWWLYYASVPSGVQNVFSLTNDPSQSAVQPGFRNGRLGVWKYGGTFLVSAAAPSAGVWHHYAYTYSAGVHRLYVDGVLVGTGTTAPQTAAPSKLEFGRWTGGSEYLNGIEDDVRIYNRALTAAEIQQLAGQP